MSTPVTLTHLATGLAELDNNKVTPGLLGFVVFAALAVATWFLVKSMNRQFKRVDFVEQPEHPAEEGTGAAKLS
ncbi:hypothetical protein [Kitasatospora sp. McL0602]|uniref:hypothetical protein n=1 Tax=Kitasatospora sp. McL0602 TaxID=3439530 RepID=UPI003F88A0F9